MGKGSSNFVDRVRGKDAGGVPFDLASEATLEAVRTLLDSVIAGGVVSVSGTITATPSGTQDVNIVGDAVGLATEATLQKLTETMEVSGSGSALNADVIPSTQCDRYDHISLQITGTFSATVAWQGSNDNVNWVGVSGIDSLNYIGAWASTTTSAGFRHIPIGFKFFRARLTTYASGTVSIVALFHPDPKAMVPDPRAITFVDRSAFTDGTSRATPVSGVFNESPSDPTEDQAAAMRITAKRALHANLRSAAGVEMLGEKASAASIPVVLSTEQQAILEAIEDLQTAANALLTSIRDNTDTLEVNTDGLETLVTATNAALATLNAKDFATEATLSAFKTENDANLDLVNAELDTQTGHLASLAAEDFSTETTLAAVLAAVDGVEGLLTSIRDNTDTLEVNTDGLEAAIAALQASIEARLNTLGQKASAASAPVVLSTEQQAIIQQISTDIGIRIPLHTRDTNNEQAAPLAPGATWTPATPTRIDSYGSVQMLYAALTPLQSVRIHWYSSPTTPLDRVLSDGVTSNGLTTVTSATGAFTGYDKGSTVTGTGIQAGTVIADVVDSTTITLSLPATADGTGISLTIGNQLSPSALTQRIISGYNVVYQIYSGFLTAPYYKLEVVNGPTQQTAFPGFICVIGLNKDQYNGVYDFVDAEPTNLTKALVVKQFHQKTTTLTTMPLPAGGVFATKGSPIAFTVDTGTDVFTSVAHGLANGSTIRFTDADSAPAPLLSTVVYYVVNKTNDTFQLASYLGGAPLDITAIPVSGSPTWFFILTAGGFTANAQGYFAATNWADIDIHAWGQPFNAQGTLRFFFSHDGITDHIGPVSVIVSDLTASVPIPLRNYAYWKADYTNGSVPQSAFGLYAIQRASVAGDLTRLQTQQLGPSEPVKVVRALIEPSLKGQRGLLGADREVFGAAVVASRVNQIEALFSNTLGENPVSSAVTGSGTATQSGGQAHIATGTDTTASSRIQSIGRTDYTPGSEVYAIFTPVFTTPTHANSHQRIGLFDDSNGVFLGYQGTTFGFTVRSNVSGSVVDTFTALADANGDTLSASFLSRFSRGNFLEAYDPTKVNVWKIRFGWLGSSVIHFEVQSPDGEWMLVHTIRQPNLSAVPHIGTPNLPLRMQVIKTSADATNVILSCGSWAAGSSGANPLSDFSKLLARQVSNTDELRLDVEPTNTDYYVGKNVDGVATSSTTWDVIRIYLSATKNPTRMRFRQGVAWDSRTSGWT